MRRPTRLVCWLCTCSAAAATLVGCSSTPVAGPQPIYQSSARTDSRQQQYTNQAQAQPGEIDRLITRLESLETDNAALKQRLSDQYMKAVAERKIEREKQQATNAAIQAQLNAAQPQANAGVAQAVGNGKTNAPAGDAGKLSRHELLDALVTQIVDGQDSERVKALMVAAISVASKRHELDHRLLDQLGPREREQVARFHQMLAVTYERLAADEKQALTRRDLIDQIDEVFGAQPLKIEALELCRQVSSYGVYEPFAQTRFLAGRNNRILIYIELENFHHEPTKNGQYEVRLEQQIELYEATGETTVWRQGPTELVDVSRNKRRDFFIVYPIDLPARLSVGGYRLKVRVADKHTGSLHEQTIHGLEIVADRAMVERGN